jgi:hypothetical protein
LAGAQDKLPVYIDGDGIFVQQDGAPSSHILKFDSPNFAHLTSNELFTMAIGACQDFDKLAQKDWDLFSRDIGMGLKLFEVCGGAGDSAVLPADETISEALII